MKSYFSRKSEGEDTIAPYFHVHSFFSARSYATKYQEEKPNLKKKALFSTTWYVVRSAKYHEEDTLKWTKVQKTRRKEVCEDRGKKTMVWCKEQCEVKEHGAMEEYGKKQCDREGYTRVW